MPNEQEMHICEHIYGVCMRNNGIADRLRVIKTKKEADVFGDLRFKYCLLCGVCLDACEGEKRNELPNTNCQDCVKLDLTCVGYDRDHCLEFLAPPEEPDISGDKINREKCQPTERKG